MRQQCSLSNQRPFDASLRIPNSKAPQQHKHQRTDGQRLRLQGGVSVPVGVSNHERLAILVDGDERYRTHTITNAVAAREYHITRNKECVWISWLLSIYNESGSGTEYLIARNKLCIRACKTIPWAKRKRYCISGHMQQTVDRFPIAEMSAKTKAVEIWN